MATTVVWRGRARSRIREDLGETLTADLKRVFREARVKQIIVNDCLKGYSEDQDKKVVLGVEVIQADSYCTHIVKIGSKAEVAADYEGWKQCVANEQFTEMAQYQHAVPLQQEYALILAETGNLVRAQQEAEKLRPLCRVFRDDETLARLGRAFKGMADRELDRHGVDRVKLISDCLPAWQYYVEAYAPYKEAFEVSGKYYPGVNAATLAFVIGRDEYEELATKVRDICQKQRLSASGDERYWIFATEGEVSLLLHDTNRAVTCYDAAVRGLNSDQKGMLQSAYNQLCRLHWALGPEVVDPVVAVFERSPVWQQLKPGPLGDCGYG